MPLRLLKNFRKSTLKNKRPPAALASSFGANLNFASTEAYNLLRTNLRFSLTEEAETYYVGITSSRSGEGKSLTSINLSYSLAQAGHRVLLLECDLRLPSISRTLGIKAGIGLTNCLMQRDLPYTDVIQKFAHTPSFDLITSGAIPPNPSELLGSKRMMEFLAQLKGSYDYVILDMPPVTAVSDPLILSPKIDGILLVVRDSVAQKQAVKETVQQLQYANANILGFVYNGVSTTKGSYGKYGKYGKYHHDYAKASQRT